MSEFRVHHHVSELMELLGVKSGDGPGAELYTDQLLKNITPYVTTQMSSHNAKRKIAESTKAPEEFLTKYDELKSKNVRDLDPLVYLLSKMCDDEQTKGYLEKNAKERALASGTTLVPHSQTTSQLPAPGTQMSPKEFSDLKKQVLRGSSVTSGVVSSDVLKKVMGEKTVSRSANIPAQPDWIFQRPYLTMDFVVDSEEPIDPDIVPLETLSAVQQEQVIIEDLLFCMEGIEGKYILAQSLQHRYAPRGFSIDQSLDPSLSALVKRILPLCANYSTVVRFIEEKSAFEYGLVNHALSAAMRSLIKDYLVLVAQLEHQFRQGQLSLQKFWFYIQPIMRTMEILASVAHCVNKGACIGGSVLSLLHEKTSNLIGFHGFRTIERDAKGQELCLYLTQAACVPYFELLEKWIYKGIIDDPYGEFLVEENDEIQKEKLQQDYDDAYWQKHYTVCRERIPVFLEQMVGKILNAGKYLNVVRQCGRDVKCPHAEEIVYTLKERQYVEHIEKAYNYASRLLLDLLMDERELMARLRSVKHYFLLDQGDFIGQFMDYTEEEMKKPMDEIMPSRLETLLELALRTSTANIDPYKDDLRVDLLPFDLITQMFKILTKQTKLEDDYRIDPTDLHLSGLEAFTFDYAAKWPVSLVLNRTTLYQYQMLFRHLYYCKHVERQLCNVWISNKSAKIFSLQSSMWYGAAFALRQRMLNFVQNFAYYMMFEVVEPYWHIFESNMDSVSNIDDVLGYQTDFLNSCLKDCMLTNPDLLKIVSKLLMVCVTFSNFIQRLNKSSSVELEVSKPTLESTLQAAPTAKDRQDDPEKRKATTKVVSDHVDQLTSSKDFEKTITNFDKNFTTLLLKLLDKILDFRPSDCDYKLMNMLYRLDFNGFYTVQLEAMSAEKSMMEMSHREAQPPVSARSSSSQHGKGGIKSSRGLAPSGRSGAGAK